MEKFKERWERLWKIGKENKGIQNFLLKKILLEGKDLEGTQSPKHWSKIYPDWSEERWRSYVKLSSHYNLVLSFGKEILGYKEEELLGDPLKFKDGTSIRPLGKKADEFGTVVSSAYRALEKKGLVDHGPANLLWGGEIFLTKKGEFEARKLLSLEELVDPRVVKEIKRITEEAYQEFLEARRKSEIVGSLDLIFPGKREELEKAKEKLSVGELKEFVKEFERKAQREVYTKENLEFLLSLLKGPRKSRFRGARTLQDYGWVEQVGDSYHLTTSAVLFLGYLRKEMEEDLKFKAQFEKDFPGYELKKEELDRAFKRADARKLSRISHKPPKRKFNGMT